MNWKELVLSKDLQPEEVDVVIFHSPCSDGMTSRVIAQKFLNGKDVLYYPMAIGQAPPPDLDGKNVLICDYSYRKDVLNKLLSIVNKLLIIDHHKSAEKDLIDLDDKYKMFDMKYSGAMLTWFYFYPEVKPPLLVEYVQDRDIWTKLLPNTDNFASWFYTLPFTYEEYIKYFDDDLLLEMIKLKGVAFGELNNYYIGQMVDYSVPKFCRIKDKYYFVAYVNSTICKSDIGNKIFDKYPLIDFSAVYSINDIGDDTSFSLRSTEGRADVSAIAFSLGGGGHACASGLRVNYVTNKLPGLLYDNGNLYRELGNIYYDVLNINGKKYNVVLLGSMIHETKLGTYLLQEKNKGVQVCRDISMRLGKECPDMVEMALVWSYNPLYDCTTFFVVIDNSIMIDEKLHINSYFQCDSSYGVSYKGMHKIIPSDQSLIMKDNICL
jgi:oligoribonuclease NrnB/cAMP/cGMP phosphodiesterase (DHH superfamily)